MTFQFGVVGVGAIGAEYLRAAAASDVVSVSAVCDTDTARAQAAAGDHGAACFSDWRELLTDSGVDAVVVATPHALHAEVSMAAAAAGRHVLVEKPMATTVQDCDAMLEACDAAGSLLGVAHVLHHVRRLVVAKELLASGVLGAVLAISARRSTHYSRASRPGWFLDRDRAGGGIMFNLGAHAFDVAQWLGGSAIDRVVGRVVHSNPAVDVETDGVVLAELANGVVVSVVALGTGMPNADDLELVCVNGTLSSSPHRGLWVHQEGRGHHLVQPSERDLVEAYQAMLEDFADSARRGGTPATDGRWGRSVVAAALQVYESNVSGQWVTVPAKVGP